MIRYIDGMVELSVPLHVHPDVLGMQGAVIIGEDKGKVSLPSMPDAGVSPPGQISFLQPASLGISRTTRYYASCQIYWHVGVYFGWSGLCLKQFESAFQLEIPMDLSLNR